VKKGNKSLEIVSLN